MNQNSKISSKAEELFYILQKLADEQAVVDMEYVRSRFKNVPYADIEKLEKSGAIHRIVQPASGVKSKLVGLRLLKDKVSIPQGKRGRKPKVEAGVLHPSPKQVAVVPAVSPALKRAVVFLDENQVIIPLKDGIGLDFKVILQKVRDVGPQEVMRLFVYCSKLTEERYPKIMREIFCLDDPVIRFIKTGNSPDEVDRQIKEDVILWSRVDFVDTIVLGTSDGGPDFQVAIDEAKKAGKKLMLLKTGASFNSALVAKCDVRIDASLIHPLRHEFERIVRAVNRREFLPPDINLLFFAEVAANVGKFFQSTKEANFMEMVRWISQSMEGKFNGYSEADVKEALDVMNKLAQILVWGHKNGKNIYKFSFRGPSFLARLRELV